MLVAAPASAQEAGGAPVVFQGTAAAGGSHLVVNTEPGVVPVETLVEVVAPEASSDWSSQGTATSRASTLYPGRTGTGGPQLLCDFGVPCPDGFPPDYPFVAEASYPGNPESSTPTGYAVAQAGEDGVTSSARLGNVVDFGPVAQAVVVDAGSARTTQRIVDGALEVTAQATLSGVVLGGGALTIDTVRVVAVSRATSEEVATAAEVLLAGVVTGDGRVVIGHEGVRIRDQGGGEDAAQRINDALAQALGDSGLTVRVLGTQETREPGIARSSATALTFSLRRPIDGPAIPEVSRVYRTYVVHGVVAEVGTVAFASDDPFALGAGGLVLPPSSGSGFDSGGGFASGSDGFDTATGTGAGFTAGPQTAPPFAAGGEPGGSAGPAPQVAPPADQGSGFGLLAGAIAGDVDDLYLILTLLTGALFAWTRIGARRVGNRLEELP